MGMTLRVDEQHAGSDEGVVYVLPIEVEASPDATVDDEARGSAGTILFAGGAVVIAVLGLLAWRAKD